jgi:protein O-mannosyl-transferase
MSNRRKARTRPVAPAPQPPRRQSSVSGLYAGLLVLAAVLAYANSLSGPFVFDDPSSIVNNAHIQHLWPLTDALSPPNEGEPVAGRPLVNLSFAINYAIGNLSVRGYHVGNLAIHICCTLLLFGLIRRALLAPRLAGRFTERTAANLAFASALVWTVHPLQTEVVDYISARTESLMSAFYLLTLYGSIRAIGSRRPNRWLVASAVACAMGMACKETMATAPLMVVLFDRTFVFGSFREAVRSRRKFYLGLAATWLLLLALVWAGPRVESAGFSTSVTIWTYLLNQSVMVPHYLRLALWPRPLVFDYGVPQALTLRTVAPSAAMVVLLLMCTAAAAIWRPVWGFLGAWFFIILAPSSSFIPISSEVGAESRMYLPLAAIVVLGVIAAHGLLRRSRVPAISAMAVALVCILLAVGTVHRNAEYQSGVTLWQTVVERRPHARAHRNLALALKAAGKPDAAIAEWRAVVVDEPDSRFELGRDLFDQGKFDEAVAEFQRFIRENAKDNAVLAARSFIAMAVSAQGKPAAAAEQWREILRIRPDDVEAKQALADALMAQGDFEGARAGYIELLKAKPDAAEAWSSLGVALSATNRADQAIAAFRKAVDLNPRDERAQLGLAAALLQQRDLNGAVQHAADAERIAPDDPAAHTLLGLALLSGAKLDEAIAEFQASLRLDPNDTDARDYLQQALTLKKRRP